MEINLRDDLELGRPFRKIKTGDCFSYVEPCASFNTYMKIFPASGETYFNCVDLKTGVMYKANDDDMVRLLKQLVPAEFEKVT